MVAIAIAVGGGALEAQSILTAAGGGTADGRPALVTPMSPSALVVDSSANVYFADVIAHQIRRLSANSGLISAYAGNGASLFSGDGGLAARAGVAFFPDEDVLATDSHDNLYIADSNVGVRMVDAATHVITTIAGDPKALYSTREIDGIDARKLLLVAPFSLAVDKLDRVYVGDGGRVFRIADGRASLIAGNEKYGNRGDGGPATEAALLYIRAIVVDDAGNVFIADREDNRVRRVDAQTRRIETIAGNGSTTITPHDDGGPATAAAVPGPSRLAFDTDGALLISDSSGLRRVDLRSGTISAIRPITAEGVPIYVREIVVRAGVRYLGDGLRIWKWTTGGIERIGGSGRPSLDGDGGPATAAQLQLPEGVTLDEAGNAYVSELGAIRRVDAATGVITTVNTSVDFTHSVPLRLFYRAGVLYACDPFPGIVYAIDAQSGRTVRIAGTNAAGFAGDGGPATEASFNQPLAMVVDSLGDVFIADTFNYRVRRVDAITGVVKTIAGTGVAAYDGDSADATKAALEFPQALAIDEEDNLYINDALIKQRIRRIPAGSSRIETFFERSGDGVVPLRSLAAAGKGRILAWLGYGEIRELDLASGTSSAFAGNGEKAFSGDGGPATAARINGAGMIGVSSSGDVYFADTFNGRMRVVRACRPVSAPRLARPADASSGESTSPKLEWSRVKDAFGYDLYLDSHNPPTELVAGDLAAATYSPANLQPLTKYYWRVVAKGDRFCPSFSSAASDVASFTTTSVCASPSAFAASATLVGGDVDVTWERAANAATYDLYFGTSDPPRLYEAALSGTARVTGLAAGTTYRGFVRAHATCDAALTTSASKFSITTGGPCATTSAPMLLAPDDGAFEVSPSPTLRWNAVAGASSYDIYLGSGQSPALYLSQVAQTAVTIPRLAAGAEITWRVVAKVACDPTKDISSPQRRFTVAACATPDATSMTTAPSARIVAGETYTVAWSEAAAIDRGGTYLVERAADASFANVVDRQQVAATAASFVSSTPMTFYHRVFAMSSCGRRSQPSATAAVTVEAGPPVVVVTKEPAAIMTKLGDKLEDERTTLALENLGMTDVEVVAAPLLGASAQFFTIVDPFGGDATRLMLQPHKPRTLDLHFSGVPPDRAGAYQSSIYVSGVAAALAFTPQTGVSLRVGSDESSPAPRLLVDGVERELAVFPPISGDDAGRPPIRNVDLQNAGGTSLDVAAEIGPESWLRLEKDWNGTPLAASSFRTLVLSTQRTRAVAGSALPRYTYLTVRNKAGQAARILVEDLGGIGIANGRSAVPSAGERSLLLPLAASGTAATTLWLSNAGASDAPVELVWTPVGADGFDDSRVLRASFVVLHNDVVALTAPVAQLFGLVGEGGGALEVRSPEERLCGLVVRAEVRSDGSNGRHGYSMPVLARGEGARLGAPHRVTGLESSSARLTSLVFTETTGRDGAAVRLTLHDRYGTVRQEVSLTVQRYGTQLMEDVGQIFDGAAFDGGYADVEVVSGGGTVAAVAMVVDRITGSGAATVAKPLQQDATSAPQPLIISGAIHDGALTTSLGLVSSVKTKVTVTYREAVSGAIFVRSFAIDAGRPLTLDDAVSIVRGTIATSRGTLQINSDVAIHVHARVVGVGRVDALPVVTGNSIAVTAGVAGRPLYADGLEQSIDETKGRRTSLILTELSGHQVTINVRLYEPGNRRAAIGERDVTVPAGGEVRFDDLFAALGLLSDPDDLYQRRKNRINVVCVVTAKSGTGAIAAEAVVTDNRGGDRRTILLEPVGGAFSNVALNTSARRRSAPH